MLSIGKLSAGQAKYYLDQAEARVDVVDSIADGIEEYYLGGREARGEWLGTAGLELGLAGLVEADELRQVLAGLDPRDGSSVRGSASRVRLAGFDLTFSAPKSVSALFGVGDEAMRPAIRGAHDRAVKEALAYLERSAAAVRRGSGGAVVEDASGLVAAGFRHRSSRAGDPQLHTHLLVANLGRGPDGRWSALDGRRLYAHARTASFVYQAVLRSEMTRTLGVEWTPVHDGIAEVVGVPVAVRNAFSRRRADIEAALQERGGAGARAAEAAALATRRPKDSSMSAEALVDEWRRRARDLGFEPEAVQRVVGRAARRASVRVDIDSVRRGLAGPLGLTRRRATFSRRDVIQALCERLPMPADAQRLEQAADAFLASNSFVALIPSNDTAGESFRRRDGRLIPATGERVLYSTREHLALEQQMVERVVASRRAGAALVDSDLVRRAMSARPTLTPDQRELVRGACLDGDLVTVVAGIAGSGKTYALAAAREAWQASGRPVVGVAVARRAAAGLREGAGIESTTVAAMLQDVRNGAPCLSDGAVLVVDEAGMVPTRDLALLLEEVERAHGKLLLVGDHHQLPELEAGGVFRGLVQRGLAIELRDNVRQVHHWEREALDELRDGRTAEALERYVAKERITVTPDEEAARRALVRDWLATSGDAVMIAHRRADVADLNRLAREELSKAGRLGREALELPGGAFAAGDLVVVKRNSRWLGIHNGDRGRVVDVDQERRALRIDFGGKQVELGSGFLAGTTRDGEPTLLRGYAITGHVAQGITVDHAFVLANHGMNAEWAYVALSRGRESNRIYLSQRCDDGREEFAPTHADAQDPIVRLATSLRGSAAQILAIDQGRPESRPRQIEAELTAAIEERRERESSQLRWLPGFRGKLAEVQRREAAARDALEQASRRRAEREHGGRQPVTERELEAEMERRARAVTERTAERRRGFGREL